MTVNISYLSEYEPYDGGYVSFGQGGGKITGKGIIKTGKLEFKNVSFVKDLKYNLFSVSQICDNKNSVLFTNSECIVLGKDFKLIDDTNVLLRTPRQHNMYSINLNNIVPHKDLTCLVTKASADKSMLWHRRLGHLNFKILNKLVRHNVVKGLPSKCFKNDHTCVACLKGKQHKASCKTKKGIKREFNNARTPQQNRVAKRRNRTLIEAARTMLADVKLPVTFWVEAVNIACYVQNRVLVNKSHNKTLYELFNIRAPSIGFLRPLGCHVMILNTLDHLGKFDAKGDEGYFIGGISNPVATSKSPPAEQMESITVESAIPTISSPVLTTCLDNSPKTSSASRLISKEVISQKETPSLDNSLTSSNRFEDILGDTTNIVDTNGVEADSSNMETNITASPTPTSRIHKDHPKSHIIGPVYTPIQTRHKSKEIEE
nr:ribonuclease H-like domain-containing protein [Tanacetum cinerariifolium]